MKGWCFAMQNKDNDDIINDILKELELGKSEGSASVASSSDTDASESVSDIDNASEDTSVNAQEDSIDSTKFFSTEDASGKKAYDNADDASSEENSDTPNIRTAPNGNRSGRPSDGGNRNNPQGNGSKKKKKKKKKQRSRLPGVLILTTFIFAVSICLSLVIIAYGKEMWGIGKSENTHLVVIPEGATTEEIAVMLENDGIIKSADFFMLFSRLSKSDSLYIAGEHFVRPNMAYETIIDELTSIQTEKKESVSVTFPEGTTLIDASLILEENGVCSADDFMFYFNAGGLGFEFEDKLSTSSNLKFFKMEGFLFPDTYYFYKDMEPEQVCQKIYLNFDNKMTDERYARMEQLNLNLDQLITFASIVQQEAATSESMTLVASVFWNRINNADVFPKLQSDPTKKYAENVIKPNMQVYDQVIVDAYNTYEGAGLPPGPICNPGIEAIDAVLEAYPSEYFYFNANIYTGQIRYAKTLEEHNNNLAEVKAEYEAYEATAGQEE